jgi:CubicO group peptidase (beta-lactamase class C family)
LLLTDAVQRGEVALRDPVAKYLPGDVTVPTRGEKQITLIDLALHTSGLQKEPPARVPINPFAGYSVRNLYDFLSGYRLTRDIGSAHEYSNFGYGLLAHALSLRANADYRTLIEARIARPLGMTSTRTTPTVEMQDRLAPGHTYLGEPAPAIDMGELSGSNALRSTANDLLTFIGAFMGYSETLARPMAAMLESRFADALGHEQAIGWQLGTRYRCAGNNCRPETNTIVYHPGGTNGYASFAGFEPKGRIGVVVLANSSAGNVQDIGMHLLDRRFPLQGELRAPKPHKEVAIDPALLARYQGRYRFPNGMATITSEDGYLVLRGAGDTAGDYFYPESERDFFSKYQDLQIRFEIDRQGRVTGFTFDARGSRTRATRLD